MYFTTKSYDVTWNQIILNHDKLLPSNQIKSNHMRQLTNRIASQKQNEKPYITHAIIESIDTFIPASVVSPGIALAISAMAFPSSCIRDTTADGDVGTDVGADAEEDIDHYLIV